MSGAVVPLVVTEQGPSRGYAYPLPNGSPYLVAGTDPAAAQTALWGALAHSTPDQPVDFSDVTAHQTWAVDVGLSAGLELHNYGYVAVAGMAVPTPYLPWGLPLTGHHFERLPPPRPHNRRLVRDCGIPGPRKGSWERKSPTCEIIRDCAHFPGSETRCPP